MFPKAYYPKTYYTGNYFPPVDGAPEEEPQVRRRRGLWSLHGTSFKHRNIATSEVK